MENSCDSIISGIVKIYKTCYIYFPILILLWCVKKLGSFYYRSDISAIIWKYMQTLLDSVFDDFFKLLRWAVYGTGSSAELDFPGNWFVELVTCYI